LGGDVLAGGFGRSQQPHDIFKQGAANTGFGTAGTEAFGAEKLSAVVKLPTNGEASRAVNDGEMKYC
jgi:hypothetical protein